MKKDIVTIHETTGIATHALRHIAVFFVTIILYRYLLFRTPAFLTHILAWRISLVILGGSVAAGFLITCGNRRTWLELAVSFLFGYGLVTGVLYYDVFQKRIFFCAIAGVVLSVVFCIVYAIAAPTYGNKEETSTVEMIAHSFRFGMAIASAFFLCMVFYRGLLVGSLLDAKMYAVSTETETVTQDLDLTEWADLEPQERLDMLGIVAGIESNHLGIQETVSIEAADLSENVVGSYRRRERVIRLNIRYLEDCQVEELINTVCHEMYHAYQWEQLENEEGLEKSWEDVLVNTPVRWSEAEYIRGEDDFTGYYNQRIETEAREYAKKRVRQYQI